MNLQDKIALITGGSKGIGAATASALASAEPMLPSMVAMTMKRLLRRVAAFSSWTGSVSWSWVT